MDYDLNDWKMILATIALIICMLWDFALHVAKEYLKIKISSCIPTNLFVLSALTIQILGYVQIQKVQVFGRSNEKELELLVSEQLKMDAARLTMCVFVGCLLPEMAMAGTQGRWSNVAALFVSLSFHIASEIYALQNVNNSLVEREAGPWFISSGALLLLGASSLLLLLGSVILSGKLARDGVRYGISQVLSKDVENEGDRWEKLRSEVMNSWVAARAWKTRYFITSSAFSPGAGMIVTVCVAFMAAKVKCRLSLLHHNNDEGGSLIFYLQCVFILVGWILMLWRWFKAGLYCSFSIEKMHFIKASTRARHFFSVPAAVVVSPICPRLAYFLLNPKHKLRNILVSISCFLPLLPLYVLVAAISLLCLFCFICRYFSVLILSSEFVQSLCKLDKESVLSNDEHLKYDSILASMGLPEVDFQHIFWKVNRKSYERIKRRMDDCKMRQRRMGLLSMMGNGRVAQNQRLQSINKSWVGTISTIFSAIAEIEIGVDMENALAAYRETVKVLKFVDYPDNIVVDPFNSSGTLNFYALRDSIHFEGEICEVEKTLKQGSGTSLEEKRERINEMLRDFRHKLERSDERASNSLLMRLEECSYYNVEELGEMLRTLVGHVIVSGLLEAPDLILKCTKQWTQNVDEKKIERAIELAAMVTVLLEDVVEDKDVLFSINEV